MLLLFLHSIYLLPCHVLSLTLNHFLYEMNGKIPGAVNNKTLAK